MITTTSIKPAFFQDATIDDVRNGLKRIAEYDFANPKRADEQQTDLMLLMLKAYAEEKLESRTYSSFITEIQYLLMFPRRRSEIAHAICASTGSREDVLKIFRSLVKAAYIRFELLRK
jgi:hypothetical protein